MSTYAISAPVAKARAMPSLCAPAAFKHYRRSTTTKAPRKRAFLVTMTKFDAALVSPVGAFSHNVGMLSCGLCCDNDNEIACGDNGNNGGNSSNNNNGNNGNNNRFGPQDSGNNEGGLPRIMQSFSHALLGALALITAVAVFPASSSAASGMSHLVSSGARQLLAVGAARSCLPALSSSPSRPRSKVMHVSCKGSTLVVPLCGVKAAEPPTGRAKIVDAPIELSGRELAIINRRQYCVRESMLV